ncbi:MAG: ATP-dependent chaperone ClpB, partial [Micavibrio sp.]|nr:ATP-dependent chaperone ClpB [Micavibrio sp.]
MNFDKFTEKTKSHLQVAQTLAMRNGHQSLEPEHLLKVMLEDSDGLVSKILKASDVNVASLKQSVDQAVAKFPIVEGSGAGGLRLSSDLSKIAANALNIAEKAGDKFVTAERFIQAMLLEKRSDIAEILENAGVKDTNLNKAINDMRKGKTADSASADDQFDALNKYAHDITQAAIDGKLDPIIGRDEEIRRTVQVLSRRTK